MGCHDLLQGIFLTQESNPGLPHCRWILYQLNHKGSPDNTRRKRKTVNRYGSMLNCFSCLKLCDLMDCSPPGFSVHGILQVRILEWVAMSSSRDVPDPGIEPGSPALQADSLPTELQGTLSDQSRQQTSLELSGVQVVALQSEVREGQGSMTGCPPLESRPCTD